MADSGNEPQAEEILVEEHRRQQLRQTRADEDAARKVRKMQLLRKFRQWRDQGELEATVRCPLCREVLPIVDFERHVKRSQVNATKRRRLQDLSNKSGQIPEFSVLRRKYTKKRIPGFPCSRFGVFFST